MQPDTLKHYFKAACLEELEAIKPGNVHIFADGHNMTVQDFISSAEVAAKEISKAEITVGERIHDAIRATHAAVGCNTNLGIVLLCAPILHCALQSNLVSQLAILETLNSLTIQDAHLTYQSIRIASPAGLGNAERHDVAANPEVTLLEAMQAASARDKVAAQYANNYADIWSGLATYRSFLQRWQRPAWATTALYLSFLSAFLDSHIERKYGTDDARQVQLEAEDHLTRLLTLDNPKTYLTQLLAFDNSLKIRQMNPGTSADLAVTTLFLHKLVPL